MINYCWTLKLPDFCTKYGTDWADYIQVTQDNIDETIEKIWKLYDLFNITKMEHRIVQHFLDILKIPYSTSDTIMTKKIRLRTYISKLKNKAMETIYLDIGEDVVGIRGSLFLEDNMVWRQDQSRWQGGTNNMQPFLRWPSANSKFVVYFNCETVDAAELDQIQDMLRDGSIKPAFYKMYLVDDSFNILRTI